MVPIKQAIDRIKIDLYIIAEFDWFVFILSFDSLILTEGILTWEWYFEKGSQFSIGKHHEKCSYF